MAVDKVQIPVDLLDQFTADFKKLTKTMLDQTKKTEQQQKSFFQKSTDYIKKYKLALTGAAIAVGAFYKKSIQLANTQAVAELQVAHAIKQTGEAAGLTAKQLYKTASALQDITGYGDEQILAGVTKQLLTFTNIVGTNFIRAQEAVLDLNAVIYGGEGSLTTMAIQLGKALEDPVKGVGALSRSGITFTEVQKEMIEQLVIEGKLFEAQTIILDEVNAKYGGQAEALGEATRGTRQLSAAWGDLMETMGQSAPITTANNKLTNFLKGAADLWLFYFDFDKWTERQKSLIEDMFKPAPDKPIIELASMVEDLPIDEIIGNKKLDLQFNLLPRKQKNMSDVYKTTEEQFKKRQDSINEFMDTYNMKLIPAMDEVREKQKTWTQDAISTLSTLKSIGNTIMWINNISQTDPRKWKFMDFISFGMSALNLATGVSSGIGAIGKMLGFDQGGTYTVPPGYENDRLPVFVGSGETLNVSKAGYGGSSPTININIANADEWTIRNKVLPMIRRELQLGEIGV